MDIGQGLIIIVIKLHTNIQMDIALTGHSLQPSKKCITSNVVVYASSLDEYWITTARQTNLRQTAFKIS